MDHKINCAEVVCVLSAHEMENRLSPKNTISNLSQICIKRSIEKWVLTRTTEDYTAHTPLVICGFITRDHEAGISSHRYARKIWASVVGMFMFPLTILTNMHSFLDDLSLRKGMGPCMSTWLQFDSTHLINSSYQLTSWTIGGRTEITAPCLYVLQIQ